jgi:hypothetical protein
MQLLRAQVAQGRMTPDQARERFALMQASTTPFQEQSIPQHMLPTFPTGGMAGGSAQQQVAALSQHAQGPTNNQMNPLQRVIQAQDPMNTRPLNMLLAQSQQQQNGPSFTSRVGQNLHPSGMGFPQGQGSLQQNLVQPTASVPSVNLPSSSAPSSHASPQGGQQMHGFGNIADAPVSQLVHLFNQLMHSVTEGEKKFLAASNSVGEADPQRQAIRAKLDSQKQFILRIRDIINAKTRRPA